MKMLVTATAAIAVVVFASAPASADTTNLLTNGNFTSNDFSGDAGWTLSGNTVGTSVIASGIDYTTPDGSAFLMFGPCGSDAILSQTFSDDANDMLSVSFYLAGNDTSPSDFGVSIDGGMIYSVNPIPTTQGEFIEFSFPNVVTATGSDTISLAFRNDPSYDELADVSVTESIPEPAGAAVLGAGLLGLAVSRRRRA